MAKIKACLVDVYETLLAYDFEARLRALAALAAVDPIAWQQDQLRHRIRRDLGLLSTAESFGLSLAACGADPNPELVTSLTQADRELMITHTRLYDDAVPFLHQLRSLGMKVALVSNCPDNTRALLAHLNLDQLAHHTILSCEIGFAKPSPEIYEAALAALEVAPTETVMVDDLEEYCGGADTAGVKAIRLAREGQQADARFPVARSLHDVVSLLVQDGLVANLPYAVRPG